MRVFTLALAATVLIAGTSVAMADWVETFGSAAPDQTWNFESLQGIPEQPDSDTFSATSGGGQLLLQDSRTIGAGGAAAGFGLVVTESFSSPGVVVRSVLNPNGTTLPQNGRNTELVVRYRFHPWFGRSIHAVQTIRHGDERFIRVEYSVGRRVRWIDLPAWMFDTGACASMILAESPAVHLDALVQLRTLLRRMLHAADDTKVKTEHSSSQNTGDAHAAAPEKVRDSETTRSVSARTNPTGVGNPASRSQETGSGSAGSVDR